MYRLVHEEGLARFYDFAGGGARTPVRAQVFQRCDVGWLESLAAEAGEAAAGSGRAASLELAIDGISCVGCVWMIETLFERQAGALRARVAANSGKVFLQWEPGACDLAGFARELHRFGYDLAQASSAGAGEHRALLTTLGLCGAFALNGMAFSLPGYLGMASDYFLAPLLLLLTALAATFALLVGGSYFIRRALQGLQQRVLHIDLPIALGIVLAYGGSLAGWFLNVEALVYFDFVTVFTFLMLGGRYLQLAAVERNRKRLQQRLPSEQELRCCGRDGAVAEGVVASGAMKAGQCYLLQPGQTAPVASQVLEGTALLSFESINGEPDPVARAKGQRVPSGALNAGTRLIPLVAEEDWEHGLLASLQNSRERDVSRYPLLERVLRAYIAIVLVAGVAGAAGWWLASGDPARSLQVMISLFVVSCPCALGVALPLADEMAGSALERFGIFVRRHQLWPRLRAVRRVVFDKTGTLTMENPQLCNPGELDRLDPAAREALGMLASSSLHPVSRALTSALGSRGSLPAIGMAAVDDLPGTGLHMVFRGDCWELVKGAGGHTELRRNGAVLASFAFAEEPRPGTVAQLAALCRRGYSLHVLSGDHEPRVKTLAAKLGIPPANATGNLSPEEKAAHVRALDQRDTLYLGDGANDSLAFNEAWCAGVPVADRSVLGARADFFFLGANLQFLDTLLATSARRAVVVHAVFAFTVVYNLAAGGLCLAGMMNPLLAAILMPLSSLATIGIVTAGLAKPPTAAPAR